MLFEIGKIEGNEIFSIDEKYSHIVEPEFMTRHPLNLPGYLVFYEDGYVSYSPKEVFEKGYTKLKVTELDNEIDRMCSVNEAGYDYDLHNFKEGVQNIRFIKKEPISNTSIEMKTVQNGTTNEAVLQVLIHRIKVLNEKIPSEYNGRVIAHLEEALRELMERTQDRKNRGVEGRNYK